MTGPGATTPRERYRAQVRAEVKEHAWEQIATAGASALSLNAIAKQMGMSGPALYRYFAGRDELITELIRDAYRSVADAFRAAYEAHEATRAASGGSSEADAPGAGVAALAWTLREWALADPHRYFLVYGTPVPGYHAPDEITAIAAEMLGTLLDAYGAQPPEGGLTGAAGAEAPGGAGAEGGLPPDPFAAHLAEHRAWTAGHPAPPEILHQALSFWTRMHGVLSLELAGHFTGMGFDPARLFAAELAGLTGPGTTRPPSN
ncbi:TetR/AcrR family transcriptional regulator [Streptomyces sp. NPDC093085]|uniref:TetR/AcrR family transcriptional regulator n=1 Tax=Streptomyces sp. NPDC093085 TaxID=3155068 RepID=UPI0034423BB5